MSSTLSQCDIPEHPDENILGLCFAQSCINKPEYCYICKTEGMHINHQNQCQSFLDMNQKLQKTFTLLQQEKLTFQKVLQKISSSWSNMSEKLYQTFQNILDECQQLIEISGKEGKNINVKSLKQRFDQLQQYQDQYFNLEVLRRFMQTIEEINSQFNFQMEKAINEFQFPIKHDSIIESQYSSVQSLIIEKKKETLLNVDKTIIMESQNKSQLDTQIQELRQQFQEKNDLQLKGNILQNQGKYDQSTKSLQKIMQQFQQIQFMQSLLTGRHNINSIKQQDKFIEADKLHYLNEPFDSAQ